jgi:hypothetical protein
MCCGMSRGQRREQHGKQRHAKQRRVTENSDREGGQGPGDDTSSRGRLLFCDMRVGEVREVWFEDRLPRSRLLAEVPHPAHVEIYDLDGDGLDDLIVADLGSFLPGDHDQGRVVWFRRLSADDDSDYEAITLLDGVGRVADVQAADLTGNGRLDLVVAEFGWRKTGRVLLLEQDELSGSPHVHNAGARRSPWGDPCPHRRSEW